MGQPVELFPTKIYRDFFPNFDQIKKQLFPKLEKLFLETTDNNNAFMKGGTLCSYHSGSYLHSDYPEETKEVVEFVESAARDYWKICNYYQELEPVVFQLWANFTPNGGWVHSHLHGNMPFTGVLYIDASPEQGNLIIENPLDMVLMSQPIGPDVPYPMGQEITVNSGDLVMFPGYIKHSVKPNTIDRPRLVLGFNIGCKGNYWSQHQTVGAQNV
jgi:uncharacterized protein (TIGR02466 family)